MKGHFRDIKTGISYTQHGDYYLPDLQLPQQKDFLLNRFGRARLRYLKEHARGTYSSLLLSGKLNKHLAEIQDKARARYDEMINRMKAGRGITEELKARDQMAWVAEMNNIRSSAEEMVMKETVLRQVILQQETSGR